MILQIPRANSLTIVDNPSDISIYTLSNGRLTSVANDRKFGLITNLIFPLIVSYLDSRSNIYTTNLNDAVTKGLPWLRSGSISEVPEPITDFTDFKIGQNNGKLWSAAKADPSLIVVSPYYVGKAKITVTPGFTDEKKVTNVRYTDLSLKNLGFKASDSRWPDLVYISGYYFSISRGFTRVYFDEVVRTYVPPILPFTAEGLCQRIASEYEMDSGLVTSTVASADTACMDVLTTLAELPQTAASVLAGFRLLIKGISDLKKGRLELSNAHMRTKKSLNDKHKSTLSDLLIKQKLAKSDRERRHWDRKISQLNKRFSIMRENAVKEFVDALASIWLNFRYNIMPMVYTVEDLSDLIDSYFAMFKTVRGFTSDSFLLEKEGWTGSTSVKISHSCVIKRRIDPSKRFSSLTQANFAVTAWELIPLSFVVDWFINIGDLISAVSSPNYSLNEGATYGWKSEGSLNLTLEAIKSSAAIEWQVYNRTVIEPLQHIGLDFNSQLKLFQKIDALALLWNPIKAQLKRSRN